MFKSFVSLVRDIYGETDFIPLHEPRFLGNEKKYLLDTIDSTFVSSVGAYVDEFERKVAEFTEAKYAIATVNGTSALHVALLLSGVKCDDEVITQSMTFVATCNAITYCGGEPIFVDVDRETMGLSPDDLESFLDQYAIITDEGDCVNRESGKIIRACVPMHTFGHPVHIEKIKFICDKYNIMLVEDSAESLGSYRNGIHTGRTGSLSALSFNGNKLITSGGGGMILTDDECLARKAKHLTTTAKKNHSWEFVHDEIGFNYRLPNLNAALGCAQMEMLPEFVNKKRNVAKMYQVWAKENDFEFAVEPSNSQSNYWLNSLIFDDRKQQLEFLKYTNANSIMTRPAWNPMHELNMFSSCLCSDLINTKFLADRLVNIPSSVPI